jgi:hypothetical protein
MWSSGIENINYDFELPYIIENDVGQLPYAIKNRIIILCLFLFASIMFKTFWLMPFILLNVLNIIARFNIIYPFYNHPTIKFFIYLTNHIIAKPLFG